MCRLGEWFKDEVQKLSNFWLLPGGIFDFSKVRLSTGNAMTDFTNLCVNCQYLNYETKTSLLANTSLF